MVGNAVSESLIFEPKVLMLTSQKLDLPGFHNLGTPVPEVGFLSVLNPYILAIKFIAGFTFVTTAVVSINIDFIALMPKYPLLAEYISSMIRSINFTSFAGFLGVSIADKKAPDMFRTISCDDAVQKQMQDVIDGNRLINYVATRKISPTDMYVVGHNQLDVYQRIDNFEKSWEFQKDWSWIPRAAEVPPQKPGLTMTVLDSVKNAIEESTISNVVEIIRAKTDSESVPLPVCGLDGNIPKVFQKIEPIPCKRVTFEQINKQSGLDYSPLLLDKEFEGYVKFAQKEGIKVE